MPQGRTASVWAQIAFLAHFCAKVRCVGTKPSSLIWFSSLGCTPLPFQSVLGVSVSVCDGGVSAGLLTENFAGGRRVRFSMHIIPAVSSLCFRLLKLKTFELGRRPSFSRYLKYYIF